jgi:hypothetical protein
VVGAHRFFTQSIVFGYGYRDHGPHVITEDDPFAEPVPGPGQDSVTRMITNLVRRRRLPVPSSRGGFATFIYLEIRPQRVESRTSASPSAAGLTTWTDPGRCLGTYQDPLSRVISRARRSSRSRTAEGH